MILHDITWYDVIWNDMVWYCLMWDEMRSDHMKYNWTLRLHKHLNEHIWHNMTQEDLDNFGHVCWKNVDIFQAALLSSATKVSKELQEKIQASSLPYLGMVNPEIVMIYIHYTSIVRISVVEWLGMDDHRTYTMFYPSTYGFCSGKSWARSWHLPALYQCSIP